jgi:hypothetical protein
MESRRDHGHVDRSTRVGGCEADAPAPEASRLCWPGMAFDKERVLAMGMPAYLWTPAGELWEFEDGVFYVTGRRDQGVRWRVDDESLAPDEGWSHPAGCECPACCVTPF